MTDQEAFDKLKYGDEATMDWVYRTKRDQFIGYFINHYSLSVKEATDLAKDALIGLVASAERNKDRVLMAQLSTLWIKIGCNLYLGEKKKADKLPVVDWDDFIDYAQNTEGGYNPFDTDDFDTLLPFVTASLNEMGEPCISILQEYYYYKEKKTDKEVAIALQDNPEIKTMSTNAVKMRRLRCLDTLRKLIFNHLK